MPAGDAFSGRQRRETAAAGPGSPGAPSLEVCPRAHQPALAAGAGMGAGRRRRSERRRRHGSSWALSPAAAPRNGRRWPWQPRCALAGGLPEGAPARPGRGGGHGGAQAPPQRAPAILTSPALHEKQSTQNPKIRANCNIIQNQKTGPARGEKASCSFHLVVRGTLNAPATVCFGVPRPMPRGPWDSEYKSQRLQYETRRLQGARCWKMRAAL